MATPYPDRNWAYAYIRLVRQVFESNHSFSNYLEANWILSCYTTFLSNKRHIIWIRYPSITAVTNQAITNDNLQHSITSIMWRAPHGIFSKSGKIALKPLFEYEQQWNDLFWAFSFFKRVFTFSKPAELLLLVRPAWNRNGAPLWKLKCWILLHYFSHGEGGHFWPLTI